MKKLYLAILASTLLVSGAFAQAANISRTDLDASTGALISSGLSNAIGQTYFDNDDRTMLLVKNASGGSLIVTEISQKTSLYVDRWGHVSLGNQSVTLANGETRLIGPFPTARFNTINGTVEISFSTVVNVSETSLRVPK